MKIIVGVSSGKEFELIQDELYSSAAMVAKLINLNMNGLGNCDYLVATGGILVMPKQVVYIREDSEEENAETE